MIHSLKISFKKYYDLFWLSGICVLAIILRLDHLSLRPLWLDEACIANPLANSLKNSWQGIIDSGNNAAYFYLLKLWSLLFGDSESALRSLSVVLSLLSIIAIYKFGAHLWEKIVGRWAAFLLAINYFSIFYAIQARHYSLVILLSILSYYYFYILLDNKKLKTVICYVLFTTLGIYTHPWFLLLLASQLIFSLFYGKIIKILISQTLAIFLSLPWIIVLWHYRMNGANNWIGLTSIKTLIDTFHYFAYGSVAVYILFGLISATLIIGYFESTKERIYYKFNNINFHLDRRLALLINYLLFPLLVALIIGRFIPFYEAGRYEAIVLPAFILLFALLFSRLKNRIIIGLLIVLLIFFSYSEVRQERNYIISDTVNERSAALNLLSLAEDGDQIVFTGLSRPTIEYYLNHLNSDQKKIKKYSFPKGMEQHPAYQDIEAIIRNNGNAMPSADSLIQKIKSDKAGRVWLVFTGDNPFASSLKEEFDKQFKEQGYLPGPNYLIILYKL